MRPPEHRRHQRATGSIKTGFTLVELLVVIAIIGTLIGLAVAAHLEADLFSDVDAAMALADWVAERDGVLRAVREAVERVEGW